MEGRLRWLVSGVALLAVVWVGYWAVATHALGRALTECGSDVLQQATSADGQRIVTAFERGCGATSPFVRIVSLRASRTPFDGEHKNEWVLAIQDQPTIQLTWTGPERLTIKYGGGGRLLRQAVTWDRITISYE